MKIEKDLIVFDLETTGTWTEKDKIIEIAIIKLKPDLSSEEFCRRVNPGIPIPKFVSELIGITNSDVRNCPYFKDIASDVATFIDDCDVAGFNHENFDIPVLRRELMESGFNIDFDNRKSFDAKKIYHINEKRDLTAAYKFYCNKELKNAHSALADTKATLEVLKAQITKYGNGDESIECLNQFKYEKSLDFYDDSRKFRWWNGDLYFMFGKYAKNPLNLQEIVAKDPKYLEWILSKDFNDDVKSIIEDALNGKFPIQEPNDFNQQIQHELF